ncbi:hypothetical protein ACEU6E_07345 [Halorutilales archaeon Cl-col2-1]
MASDIYRLKTEIEEAYPSDEPPWKAYGRIQLKTGVDLGSIGENDTVSDDEYEAVRKAAEEITGEEFEKRAGGGEGESELADSFLDRVLGWFR